jgi:hypothetical protein
MNVAPTGATRYIGSHVLTEVQAHGHEAPAKTAKSFGLPIACWTINIASGQGKPTVPELTELLEDSSPIDRTSINAWEDVDSVAAVRQRASQAHPLCPLDRSLHGLRGA